MATEQQTPTRLRKALKELLAAAEVVKAGLDARIDAADTRSVPVFTGITALHAAIGRARAALSASEKE